MKTSVRSFLRFMPMALVAVPSFVLAEVTISFEKSKWNHISIGSAKDNSYNFGKSILVVSEGSESPILYKLESPTTVSAMKIRMIVNTNVKGGEAKTGDVPVGQNVVAFPEDFPFKIGLVVVGDNQLGAMGKLFAPKWVKNIFDLAPNGKGIDKVYFQNIVDNPSLVGLERTSPKSKYMYEQIVAAVQTGEQEYVISLKSPVNVSGIWLSSDTDNLNTKTVVQIQSLVLQ